jgi:predicted PurR-regulated permease PerM
MVAGIGGAVVAVPLVAVTNTVVGYLRQYSLEVQGRQAAPEPADEPPAENAGENAEDPAHLG